MSDTVTSSHKCGCGGHKCAQGPAPEAPREGCGCGSHHAKRHAHACATRNWRRTHATIGAALTLFILLHLSLAALAFAPATFEAVATTLRAWTNQAPLLLYDLLGALIAQGVTGARLLHATRHGESPLRMSAQRWSGVLVLAFVLVHVLMALLRGVGVTPSAARAVLFAGNPLLVAFYTLALAGLAWHAGHGVWTGASSWGLREKNPALCRAVAVATGVILAALGGAAIWALSV
jgi:succinate dehydrogenase/fumarate reductase cytochrome b subunit